MKHDLNQVGGEHGTSNNNYEDWLGQILIMVSRL